MNKLANELKAMNNLLNDKQPDTMDAFMDTVINSGLLSDYGFSVKIVRYMGAIQGVRIEVSGRKKTHYLPSEDKVYSVFKGFEKYIRAGW